MPSTDQILQSLFLNFLPADRELLHLVDGYQGPVLYTDEIMQLEDVDVELKKPQIHDLFTIRCTDFH